LFAGCASQQVTAGPVHAQFAYVILFSAISSLALRDVNGERFRFQVSIRCCRFNFSQGYRRQVNVRIAALAVNGNSTGYIGNFTEEINLAAANSGISCMGSSHAKNAVAIAAEKNLFHSHFLVRVNYESMSTL
jgi:hypothetical protein